MLRRPPNALKHYLRVYSGLRLCRADQPIKAVLPHVSRSARHNRALGIMSAPSSPIACDVVASPPWVRAGILPWTTAPYGYLLDPLTPRDPAGVRIEESEAALVRAMFTWYVDEGVTL